MNGVSMRYQLNLLTIIFDDFCFKAGSICWYTMKIHLNIRINNLKGKTGKNVKKLNGKMTPFLGEKKLSFCFD